MTRALVIMACCLLLSLIPPGAPAQAVNTGQGTSQTSTGVTGVPKTRAEAQKKLKEAENLIKGMKYQEAEPLLENVKKSSFTDLAAEAQKLQTEIKTALERKLGDAESLINEMKYQEAKPLLEYVKKSSFTDLKAKAQKLQTESETALTQWSKLNLASCYNQIGQNVKALAQVEDVIKGDPKNPLNPLNPRINEKAQELIKKITEAPNKEVKDLLASAEVSVDAGDYEGALKAINQALTKGASGDTKTELDTKLQEALEKKKEFDNRKSRWQINDAERLIEQGELEKASKNLLELIQNIKNDQVLQEARKAWDQTKPTNWDKVTAAVYNPVKPHVRYVFIIAILMAVLWTGKRVWTKFRTSKKLQICWPDSTANPDPEVTDIFFASLQQWGVRQARAREGLLRLEVPRSAALLGPMPNERLLEALEGLPSIVGVELNQFSAVIKRVCNWFTLCPPWIKATLKRNGDQVSALVILQRKKDQVALVDSWPKQPPSGGTKSGNGRAPESDGQNVAAGSSVPDPLANQQPETEKGKEDGKATESGSGIAVTGAFKTDPLANQRPDSGKGEEDEKSPEPGAEKAAAGGANTETQNSQPSADELPPETNWQVLQKGIDSLAFKVLYLLSEEDATLPQAEAFDRLRQGLARLNMHLTGVKKDSLKDIGDRFREVQQQYPRLLPAFLYEGITLDLLGDHTEAARRFKFVKEKALEEGDKDLNERAAYNEAIAHLHNYASEGVQKAQKLLGDIAGSQSFKKSPLKAMAYAAQACVVAHWPLFWKEFEEPQDKLDNWQTQVKKITGELAQFVKEVNEDITTAALNYGWRRFVLFVKKGRFSPWRQYDYTKWSRYDCRKLELGIHDALAHLNLNCAMVFNDGPIPIFEEGSSQKGFLEEARKEFLQCELLQTPEAENQADMGTMYLFLGEYKKAQEYLEQAFTLKNEKYEYACLRLAQTYAWDKQEGNSEKVAETLKRYRGPRLLTEFKEMCKCFNVQ